MIVERKPSAKYPASIKAEAIELFQAGYGVWRIEEELKARHNGAGPSHSTLAEWRNQADISGLIRTQSEELAVRAGHLIHRAFDNMDELDASALPKHLIPLNAVRGTNQDKLRDQPGNTNNLTFVLVQAQQAADPHTEIELTGEVLGTKDADT